MALTWRRRNLSPLLTSRSKGSLSPSGGATLQSCPISFSATNSSRDEAQIGLLKLFQCLHPVVLILKNRLPCIGKFNASSKASTKITNIPTHTELNIVFYLYAIDFVEYEEFMVSLDGVTIY